MLGSRHALAYLAGLNQTLKRTTHVYMVLVAALIGVLSGYGAVGFRLLIKFLENEIWQTGSFTVAHVASLPWFWVVAAPAAGGLLVGYIVERFAPEAKGHGVPEVMEAVALQQGRIRPRVVAAKSIASGVCIASGGSVGREGPIVQIGSAIGSSLGQILQVRTRRLRTLVACGAAGGIAATFNAPVAGALFAVEILLGDFGVPQFSPIVISSVVATVVSRHYLGDFPAFEIPEYTLKHPVELVAYVVLGVAACFTALAFIRLLYFSEDAFDRLKVPLAVKAAFGGACVGAIALLYPGVLGVGYEEINHALMGQATGWILGGLLVAKLLAVSLTIGSGGSGGIFAPSLFLGAMLGGGLGSLMSWGFPGQVAEPGAYALVGMGAVVAAATHAPITAIVIIFELTSDYHIILPLMMACIIGTLMITRLQPESIYTLKLIRRGIRVRQGTDINLLKSCKVAEVVRRDVPLLAPNESLLPILEQVSRGSDACFYVLDEEHRLQGVVSMNELRPLIPEADLVKHLVVAADIAATDLPAVDIHETLDKVLTRLDLGYRDELPVVDGDKFVGAVRMEDVLNRYRTELFRHEMAESVASSMQPVGRELVFRKVGVFAVAEIDAPSAFYGQTLEELAVRQRFDITVLLVHPPAGEGEHSEPVMAEPDTRVGPGDRLVVFVLPENITRLSSV